ncbi:hypothetical protein D5018_15800 [Parashewanella curva]|uniref:ubiquitinyl hydrolase 1 n=1 Tax=Parashewanella curva TaxID=2338552 RepID=A0A3L8PXC7_9GAMM|nr:hypothetical protein [Parashewanella curva]RLV58722.1 hypothetical protein D5018_15800 [Parashewanella curva]
MSRIGSKTQVPHTFYESQQERFSHENDKNIPRDIRSFSLLWIEKIKPVLPQGADKSEYRTQVSVEFYELFETKSKEAAEQKIVEIDKHLNGQLQLSLEFKQRYGNKDGYILVLKDANGDDVQRFTHIKLEQRSPQALLEAEAVSEQEVPSDFGFEIISQKGIPRTEEIETSIKWWPKSRFNPFSKSEKAKIVKPKAQKPTKAVSSPKLKESPKSKASSFQPRRGASAKTASDKTPQKVIFSNQKPDASASALQVKQTLEGKMIQSGLVKSHQQFDILFSRVDVLLYSELQLATRLAIYQKIQPTQKDDLLDEFFGLVLDAPYFDLSPDEIGNEFNSFPLVAKAAHTKITSKINVIPKVTDAHRAIEFGVTPKGAGLYNWGNTCFMNSALQLLSIHLKLSDGVAHLKRGIPLAAAKDIVLKALPSNDFSGIDENLEAEEIAKEKERIQIERAKLIDRWATIISGMQEEQLASQPVIIPEYPNVELTDKLVALIHFKNEFLKLQERLQMDVTESEAIASPAEQQQDFLKAYLHFAQITNRLNSLYIFDMFALEPQEFIFANIPQQDPQEFLMDIMDIFGLNLAEGSHIQTREVLHLNSTDGRTHLTSRLAPTPNPLAMANAPVEGREVTLDSYLEQFSREEELQKKEAFYWDDGVLERHKVKPENVITTKQIKFHAESSPPDQFIVQLKLFEKTDTKPTCIVQDGEGSQPKIKDVGLEVIHSLLENNRRVKVSMHIGEETEPTNVEYQVVGISCHAGSGVRIGHYTALKFNPDGSAVFLDDDVAVDWREFYKARDMNRSVNNLKEFCEQRELSGYLYSLKRVDAD